MLADIDRRAPAPDIRFESANDHRVSRWADSTWGRVFEIASGLCVQPGLTELNFRRQLWGPPC